VTTDKTNVDVKTRGATRTFVLKCVVPGHFSHGKLKSNKTVVAILVILATTVGALGGAAGSALADPLHCAQPGWPSCYSVGYQDGQANPGTSCPSGHSDNFCAGWYAASGTFSRPTPTTIFYFHISNLGLGEHVKFTITNLGTGHFQWYRSHNLPFVSDTVRINSLGGFPTGATARGCMTNFSTGLTSCDTKNVAPGGVDFYVSAH
jgi:hypothetical protein